MNKIFKIYVPLIIVVASLLLSTLAFTKEPTNRKSLAKAAALETEVVDGNRIFNYINIQLDGVCSGQAKVACQLIMLQVFGLPEL